MEPSQTPKAVLDSLREHCGEVRSWESKGRKITKGQLRQAIKDVADLVDTTCTHVAVWHEATMALKKPANVCKDVTDPNRMGNELGKGNVWAPFAAASKDAITQPLQHNKAVEPEQHRHNPPLNRGNHPHDQNPPFQSSHNVDLGSGVGSKRQLSYADWFDVSGFHYDAYLNLGNWTEGHRAHKRAKHV